MKLSLNARARVVAESYLTAVRAFEPSPYFVFVDACPRLVRVMILWSCDDISRGETSGE